MRLALAALGNESLAVCSCFFTSGLHQARQDIAKGSMSNQVYGVFPPTGISESS